ncbi:MAG TPA: methyltransferase domain-containing protein [Mycobacterium sp.]|uniref:class I SAM-dependent methyltransferase n=1 Tax=Mycobacterium sp. TaxID=1785 RepID=UPI002F40EB6B
MIRYDRAGRTYSATRQADPRIGTLVDGALRGMAAVANIGAGTGSYEPSNTVVAVEPSTVMIRQRSDGAAPVVRAVAEHLPLSANAVDAALAVLTVHHWSDVDAGIAEMIRVARRRIVILTWDHNVFRQFWLLREYLPAAAEMDLRLAVPVTKLLSLLGDASVQTVPIPYDCADGFGGAYWRRPHAYLNAEVRAGISMFALMTERQLREGLSRLDADLATGGWADRHSDLIDKPQLDLGYRLIVSDLSAQA